MSRVLGQTLRAALAAPETGEVPIALLTLTAPGLSPPIRLAQNSEGVTSRGDLFEASPFDLVLPDEAEDRPPRGRLAIENLSRAVVQSLRALTEPATVTIEIVLASDPDTVEAAWPEFRITLAEWDVLEVSTDFTQEPFLKARFPAVRFDPSGFPGLFP